MLRTTAGYVASHFSTILDYHFILRQLRFFLNSSIFFVIFSHFFQIMNILSYSYHIYFFFYLLQDSSQSLTLCGGVIFYFFILSVALIMLCAIDISSSRYGNPVMSAYFNWIFMSLAQISLIKLSALPRNPTVSLSPNLRCVVAAPVHLERVARAAGRSKISPERHHGTYGQLKWTSNGTCSLH